MHRHLEELSLFSKLNLSGLRPLNINPYHLTWLAPQSVLCTRDSMKLSPSPPPAEARDTGDAWPQQKTLCWGPYSAPCPEEGQRNLAAVLTEGSGWRWHWNGNPKDTLLWFTYLFSLMHRGERVGSRGRLVPTSCSSSLCLQPMEPCGGGLRSTAFVSETEQVLDKGLKGPRGLSLHGYLIESGSQIDSHFGKRDLPPFHRVDAKFNEINKF